MWEEIDWDAYYEKEAELLHFDAKENPLELHRCLAAWSVFPKGTIHSMADVGCGDGYFCHWIRQRADVRRVVGIDGSLARIQRAANTYPDVEFSCGKLPRLSASDEEFQVVTCIEVLEHQKDPVEVVREIARIAKERVVITVPDRSEVQEVLCPQCLRTFPFSGHLQCFDRNSLTRVMERAGLVVENLRVHHSGLHVQGLGFSGWCRKIETYMKLLIRPDLRGQFLACRARKKSVK